MSVVVVGGECRWGIAVSQCHKDTDRKRVNDAIDSSVSEEAASICVKCALSPVDRHSALKYGLAQWGASFCREEMLNTEDVRDTRLRASLLPIQEQRGENANPMIMYICSRVFRGFERFFSFSGG